MMNYVKELENIKEKFVEYIEKCDNRIIGDVNFDETNECVKVKMMINYHSQPKFYAEQDYNFALQHETYAGNKLREVTISFKLNKKFRFDDMKWDYEEAGKTYSMKNFEEGFEDFLIENMKGYKQDLEARHEMNLQRIENEIEEK